ncbi:major facilitator superfamily domain-containing protein [Mycena epipterygia]|nr:major facilitator superfamily domain-containing protein [Mycena epipterygia]
MSEKVSPGKLELSGTQNDVGPPLRNVHNILNADLALALSTGPQLKPLSAQVFKLYLVLWVSFMGALSFGYDTTVISSVNGMVQYTDYFSIGGGATGGGQGVITAMLYSLFTFGCIVGSFVAGPMADRWGRRRGMFTASMFILAGVSTVTAAQSRIYLFVGRFLIGFGSVLNNCAAPAYVAEISPPQWRGRLAGLYNGETRACTFERILKPDKYAAFTFIGSIVCSVVAIGTGRILSTLSWRIPFAIQFIPTIILAVGVCFIPESPRWLVSVGRKDEARAVLATYHGNGNANSPLVVLEWRELETCIKTDGSDKRWWDYSELFNSRGARYRTFIISWLALCCLWSGTGIFYYVTVAFDLAGVKTQDGRLIFSSVAVIMGGIGALVGASIVDRIGRRTLWIWGTACSSITLGLAAGFTAKANSEGAIAALVIFSFFVNMTYTPLQGMYPSECLNFSNRSKGLALFALIESLAAMVNNFAGAVAFQKIGWKYMLVPAAWDVVETIVIWMYAVETKGRTLEELDVIFEDHHPVNASLNKHSGRVTAEG